MSDTRAPMERLIRANADEINRLRQAIRVAAGARWRGPEEMQRHAAACAEFNHRYERLAFPGGYANALRQLAGHDPNTVDVVLTFLEVRPFFFRSGYMWKTLLKRVQRVPMGVKQRARMKKILDAYAAYRAGIPL
ncbi:hypothetical protein [Stenotrophomonas sp. NA06056]|uniref:hypothetical protein n=1 Tax=Stenotrophomonas sp. NA06056 TaxID=2742129 RepID=UPI0015899CA2|nr:hypothetical protein [Stenotrophomonas sp. NA06056]QKW57649.1 hypothetical protein HUT07_13960 [Stenotrophomonas sp. NA06056]